MLVLISLPYNARYHQKEGTHLWFFYKQIDSLSEHLDKTLFMGWENNYLMPQFISDDAWEKNAATMEKLEYKLPSEEDVSKTEIINISQSIFTPLEEQLKSNNLVWRHLIKFEYEPLKNMIKEKLEEVSKNNKIDAIVLCCNLPSAEAAGRELAIPVIHTEIGPTRKPQYLQTAYWDLSGVNGNTEAVKRFTAAKDELKDTILSKRELRALFMDKDDFIAAESIPCNTEYEIGVAGQVDDDSNIIAYSNGFNNLEVLKYANFHFGKSNVLFRSHPGAQTYFSSILDRSSSPIHFFKRINKLITINSSMAFEASLWEKPVMVLGDSPFQLLSDDIVNNKCAADKHIEELNFLALNYIIPYELIFDYDYYMWRLSSPSEAEIRKYHLNFYLNKKGFSCLDNFIKDIPVQVPAINTQENKSNVLEILAGNIPNLLEHEQNLSKYAQKCRSEIEILTSENEKLSAKLDTEITHYKNCLANFQKELAVLNEAYQYNKQDAQNYKQAYEYNESEAKRLASLLQLETEKFTSTIEQQQKQIDQLDSLLEEKNSLLNSRIVKLAIALRNILCSKKS